MEYKIVDVIRGIQSIKEIEDRKRTLEAQGKDYLVFNMSEFVTNIIVIDKKN